MISEKEMNTIREAAEQLYYVSTDKEGRSHIDLSADYRDDNKSLLQVAYDHRDDDKLPIKDSTVSNLLISLKETISEAWCEAVWLAEDEILRKAGFEPDDDRCEPQKDWLRENIPILPPYDHYLDQSMRVNILLCTSSEPNHCFSDIHTQYLAMADPERLTDGSPEACNELLQTDTSLKRLVEQQGYTMDALAKTMQEYKEFFYDEDGLVKRHFDVDGNELSASATCDLFNNEHSTHHSKFLTSICQELENQRYQEGFITVLAEVSMNDFVNMMKAGSQVTMSEDCMCGIFCPDNGAGSMLEVELEKPVVFTRDDIYDVQIEGSEPDWGYNLDTVYGLIHSCWKQPSSIENIPPENVLEPIDKVVSSTLDEMLASASARAAAQRSEAKTFDGLTR